MGPFSTGRRFAMTTAAEREQRQAKFLSLAEQAEQLRSSSSRTTDAEGLKRFQNLFADELAQLALWRAEVVEKPATGSADEFQARIEYANKVLDSWNRLPPKVPED